MVVVDTSVWIDLLNNNPTEQVAAYKRLVEGTGLVGLTDVILTEVLQGFNSEREAKQVEAHLLTFPILRLESVSDFVLAADLRRTAKRAGIRVKTADCLIAVPCIHTGAPLLHADKEFDLLATCTPLKIWK